MRRCPRSGPLNTPVTFSGGLGEWAPNTGSCTLTLAQGPQPGIKDEGPVYYGTASALLTPLGAGAGYTFAAVNSGSFPAGPGQRFLAQAWVWSGLGYPTIQVGCDWFDINGEYLTSSLGTATAPASAWAYVSAEFSSPDDPALPVVAGQMRLGMSGNPTPANYMFISYAATVQVTGQVPYLKETTFDYDNSYLYTEVQTTQQEGPNQLIIADQRNPAAIQQYFRRSALTFTSNAESPYDVNDLTTWTLARYSQPGLHLSTLTLDLAGTPNSSFAAVLHLDIGDIVTVTRHPIGGYAITETCVIERVAHEVGPSVWKTTFQLSPYNQPASVQTVDGNTLGAGQLLSRLVRACPQIPASGTAALSPRSS